MFKLMMPAKLLFPGVCVSLVLLCGPNIVQASPGAGDTPAGASFSSSCSGLGFAGGGNAGNDVSQLQPTGAVGNCTNQTSAIGGSAASTASDSGTSGGVPWSGTATSAAGPLAIHLNSTNSGGLAASFPGAYANGGWTDGITLTSPTQTGTGIFVIPILVDGQMMANGNGAQGLLSVAAFLNKNIIEPNSPAEQAALNTFNALNDPLFRGSPSGASWDYENVEWRVDDLTSDPADSLTSLTANDVIDFAIPFTWGVEFDLGIFASVQAGEESAGGASTITNTTTLAFQNTISLAGPGYVLTNGGTGPATTDFSISTLTGTNYDPQLASVPEPASLSLLCAGLVGMGLMRRRRQSRMR